MFSIVRNFMLISAVFALAVGIVIYYHHRQMVDRVIEYAERENLNTATVFANSVWRQFRSHIEAARDLDATQLRTHPRTSDLREALYAFSAQAPILKVKLYNTNELTVYSSNPQEIGEKATSEGYFRALQGVPASGFSEAFSPSRFSHLSANRPVVESYMPIKDSSGEVEAVMEIYTDVSTLMTHVERDTVVITSTTLILISLFYGFTFLIVRRANLIIQNQYSVIQNKNAALSKEIQERKSAQTQLQELNDTLENHVEKRTWQLNQELEQRRKLEARLRNLTVAVEQSPAMTMITDPQGNIEYVNPRFEAITGYALDSIKGSTPMLLEPQSTPSAVYQEMWKTISSGNEWRGELRNRKKNGELFWMSALVSPIQDAHGNITHFLSVAEDITERKRIEEENRMHYRRLAHEGRISILGEMATELAHELNQPLSVISGSSQLALSENGDIESVLNMYRESLRDIAMQAEHARQIITRVRQFAGRSESEQKIVEVDSILDQAVKLAKIDAADHDVSITLDKCKEGLLIRADPIQIEQVLVNLIQNAVDALSTVEDLDSRTIRITTHHRGDDAVEISVRNPGPAIAPATLERIFEPYYTTKDGGLGMGLAIARSIVEAHGGHLWASSLKRYGTTFTFSLPSAADA